MHGVATSSVIWEPMAAVLYCDDGISLHHQMTGLCPVDSERAGTEASFLPGKRRASAKGMSCCADEERSSMFRDRFVAILGQTLLGTVNSSAGVQPPLFCHGEIKRAIEDMPGLPSLEDNIRVLRSAVRSAACVAWPCPTLLMSVLPFGRCLWCSSQVLATFSPHMQHSQSP